MHDLRPLLKRMVEGGDTLRTEEARAAIGAMLDGDVADVEIAALLTALAQRGETVDEVTGVVMALRERLMQLPVTDAERAELVDTCGTGGDGSGTFNISTAAALVAALRPLLPAPPPGAPGRFALSEESAPRSFATGAGLSPEKLFDVESPFRNADLDSGIRGLSSSGVAARARQASGAEAVDEAHRQALGPFRQPDGSYRIPATFRCLVARANHG